jgi:hypothetical protein
MQVSIELLKKHGHLRDVNQKKETEAYQPDNNYNCPE